MFSKIQIKQFQFPAICSLKCISSMHTIKICVLQVGRILKRDREKCRAMVQLERYEEQVFTYDYDAICHYVGGTEH